MVLKRLFGNRRSKGTWVAGLFIDPPEVSYAIFDRSNPEDSIQTGVASGVPTAIAQLMTWQTEAEETLQAIGVNERLLGRVVGSSSATPVTNEEVDVVPPKDLSPPDVVRFYLQENGLKDVVVPVASAPWLLEALHIPVGPRAGAVVDRSNLAVGLRDDGSTWVAGEWSDAYARNGSIGSIIIRAANLLAEILDGRTQVSGLRTALPAAIGKEDPLDFFAWVDHQAHEDISGCLAVLDAVYALSRSGDALADRLVNLIAADIGRTIVAAIEQMRLQDTRLRVHLTGRVLERIPNLRTGILRRIEIVNDSVHLENQPLMNPGEALARAVADRGR